MYAGWKDALNQNTKGVNVSFSKSTDNGSSWTPAISMESDVRTGGYKSDPWMNFYNKTVYYSYLDYSNDSDKNPYSQVTMARSGDMGDTWQVSKASKNNFFADKESFTISPNGTIYLFYDDINLVTNLGAVVLARSTNGGSSFTDISNANGGITDLILAPYSAVSLNQTLFVAWLKINNSNNNFGDIYYSFSTNNGNSFVRELDLNPEGEFGAFTFVNSLPSKSTMPVVKIDSTDRIYLVWAELDSHWRVYLKYSDDFGSHWSQKIPIHSESNTTDQWMPDMAIDSIDTLHFVWYEESQNQYKPYYRALKFTGSARSIIEYSNVIPVASAFTPNKFSRPGDYCTIKVDSFGIPHVVWTDGRSGNKLDIYYAQGSQDSPKSTGSDFSTFFIVLIVLACLVNIRRKKLKIR